MYYLSSESVQRPSLSLERVHDIQSSHSLPSSVFSVGHCVSDDVFEENLEHISGFVVDQATNPLDTTASCESADGRLGDALDVLTDDTSMTLLGTHFSESLAAFTTSNHDCKTHRFVLIKPTKVSPLAAI